MEVLKEQERKNMPVGMRLMEDPERLDMLRMLEHNKRELMTEIERLPITMKTISMQKRRDELEEKYRNIEIQIDRFSRKKVFVAL